MLPVQTQANDDALPSGEVRGAGHLVHVVAPSAAAAYVPTVQFAQAEELSAAVTLEYVPAMQLTHADMPAASPYVPAAQDTHIDDPAVENLPRAQSVHMRSSPRTSAGTVPSNALCLPAGQSSHSVAPQATVSRWAGQAIFPLLNLPVGHSAQLIDPLVSL